MPISTEAHSQAFVEPKHLADKLQDVAELIRALVPLDINLRLKKRMLGYAVWQIATSSGDFKGRYRSKGVITQRGVKIQRDHVLQKKTIVERLLQHPEQMEQILQESIHCVVTEEEHKLLTDFSRKHPDIDGWQRYSSAGITVIDMLTGEERT